MDKPSAKPVQEVKSDRRNFIQKMLYTLAALLAPGLLSAAEMLENPVCRH